MKKYCWFISVFIFMLSFSINAYGGANVKITIESYDKTLTSRYVEAETFKDAILETEIPVKFDENGKIESVNGIEDHRFSANDGWRGYIKRNEKLTTPQDFLDSPLYDDDQIVLYYGGETKIITDVGFTDAYGKFSFEVTSKMVQWKESEGKWSPQTVSEPIASAKIHITTPGGSHKIVITDENGKAESIEVQKGIYKYYIEGYNVKSPPSVVKTEEYRHIYGIDNSNSVTRGEACWILAQHMGLKKTGESSFYDTYNHRYSDGIQALAEKGAVNGYPNGTFLPDGPISFLEFNIITVNLLELQELSGEPLAGLPEWAQPYSAGIREINSHRSLDADWLRPLTLDDLLEYINRGD